MLLPAKVESVCPVASVHMSSQSTCGERPVLLMAQHKWCSEFTKIALILIVFLQEQHRHDRRFVVSDVTFRIRGIIGVNAVRVDSRDPVWIILGFTYRKV